ncbi:MAG: hypothetical protein E7318_03760 [Clostridiales bacterium]|nr:hypothetical protein [Clostridiales bacterium]
MLHIKPKILAALTACSMIILAMGGMAMGEAAGNEATMTISLQVNGYELVFQGPLTEGTTWQEIPETEDVDIRFCMPVRGEVDVPLFTMILLQPMGDYAMMLEDAQGIEVPVSFHMAPRPPGLTDEEKWAFTWAQADVFVLMETLRLTAVPDEKQPSILEEPMRVVTDAFELTYSAQWRGRLSVEPGVNGSIVFNAVIDSHLYPVFILRYGADDGNYVITLRKENGQLVDVSFDMLSASAEFSPQARTHFYEIQEVIAEITSSITLR